MIWSKYKFHIKITFFNIILNWNLKYNANFIYFGLIWCSPYRKIWNFVRILYFLDIYSRFLPYTYIFLIGNGDQTFILLVKYSMKFYANMCNSFFNSLFFFIKNWTFSLGSKLRLEYSDCHETFENLIFGWNLKSQWVFIPFL